MLRLHLRACQDDGLEMPQGISFGKVPVRPKELVRTGLYKRNGDVYSFDMPKPSIITSRW